MKLLKQFILIFIITTTLLYAESHLPWSHTHDSTNTAECYAYAMGRAYGKTSSNECNPLTMSGNGILTAYFYKVDSTVVNFNNINTGDVVTFSDHAVYVTNVDTSIASNIDVDHKKNPSDPEEYSTDLQSVINAYGAPIYVWRKTNNWKIEVKNSYEGGRVQTYTSEKVSPDTVENLKYGEQVSIYACDNGRVVNSIKRIFKFWNMNDNYNQTNIYTSAGAWGTPTTIYKYTAEFDNYYHFTFQNNFVGLSNNGNMKVNDTTRYNITLQDTFWVKETESISFEEMSHSYNNINYNLDHWNDQSTLNSRTISNVTDHASYTAYYEGRPSQVTDFMFDCGYNEPVYFTWAQYPNSNVKYRIYRKMRNQYGTFIGPTLLATLNNNQTYPFGELHL